MIDDLIQQQTKLQKQVDGLIKPELSPDLISPFLSIPGLIGFWPTSSVQRSTGNAYDQSGQGRTLTYNGNPTYNYYNNIVPYIDLDGVGDYLSRADETDLRVLGTETIYAAGVRGLTLGGWFWLNNVANTFVLMSKWGLAQMSYQLAYILGSGFRFDVTTDGSTQVQTYSSMGIATAGRWYFICGRLIPSTSETIYENAVPTVNTATTIASIFNGSATFQIGRNDFGTTLTGRASLCFLSANALSNAKISSIFQQTRGAFGV